MRLLFDKISDSPLNILRRLGYSFIRKETSSGELSFVKRVGSADYPRFHIFVRERDGGAELTLHLDQKKASYQGSTAHSGEYGAEENQWLEREAETIRNGFGSSS